MNRIFLVCFYFLLLNNVADAALQHDTDQKDFSVLDQKQYQQVVSDSRSRVENILNSFKPHRQKDLDAQVAFIASQFADLPYIYQGGMGEGDWHPAATSYKPGSLHIQQNPVYRLDSFDCQSLVQTVMALLYSKNLSEFDEHILKISYGAAGNPGGEIVRYYNRNNFIDADFNPINQRNGWLIDVTTQGALASQISHATATITRQNWFSHQQEHLGDTVRVLKQTDGASMVRRFLKVYSNLNYPHFQSEKVTLSYLPKALFAIRQANGTYQLEPGLFSKIPTPAVIEIVADSKKWNIDGQNIKEAMGTELNVSHVGLAYRQVFHRGDLIYHKIICSFTGQQQKACIVTPITCQKKKCNEIMFVHATNAYPNDFYWYQRKGNFVCSPNPPSDGERKPCNRVEQIPLFNYLTDYQYGSYWHMSNPAMLGLHIEKLA